MKLSLSNRLARKARDREAVALHRIEGYEFTDDQNAMFAMFDREGYTDEERLAYIKARAEKDAARAPEPAE